MAHKDAILLADFLESRKSTLYEHFLKSLNPILGDRIRPLVQEWMESQIQQFRGGPDRSAEWAALLIDHTRASGVGIDEAIAQLRTFRQVTLQFCRGHYLEIGEGALYETILEVEDRVLKHVAEHVGQVARDLLASERRRQRVLMEAMDCAFATLTPDGIIDSANEYFARYIGLPLDAMIGKELASLCDETAAAELRKIVRQKRSVGSHVFNGALVGPKSRRVSGRFEVHFIFDAHGRRSGMTVAYESATPSSITVKDCLAYLGQDLLNYLPSPLQVLNRERTVVYANMAAQHLQIAHADPDKPYCCQLLRPLDSSTGKCVCHQVLETGAPHIEEVSLGGELDRQWYEMYLFPIREPEGDLNHFLCSVRDVTKDRALTKTLEKQMLAQQHTSLASQLAITVAHQLRNPMGVIIGYSEMLSRGLPPEQIPGAVDKLLRNGLRCKEIVEDLLEFGQGLPGERLATEINALIRNTVQPMFTVSQSRRIDWRLSSQPVLVESVPHQLTQVFVSLLQNALQAAGEYVQFEVSPQAHEVVIRITDDGPGVREEIRDRIFQPFFTTRKESGAVGLGLSLSQSVIAEYGGKITLETPAEGGACFVIHLPLASEGQPSVAPEAEKEPAATGKHILVVDDELDLLDMLAIVLEQRGYIVEATSAGGKAIDLLQRKEYDAIILDVQLPGDLSGPQLYAYLHQTHPQMAQRTLFITADTMNYETRRFLDKVQRPFMEKPFLVSEFLVQVSELLQE